MCVMCHVCDMHTPAHVMPHKQVAVWIQERRRGRGSAQPSEGSKPTWPRPDPYYLHQSFGSPFLPPLLPPPVWLAVCAGGRHDMVMPRQVMEDEVMPHGGHATSRSCSILVMQQVDEANQTV